MKVEITNREKNPLLNREEIEFSITESAATPSRKELRERISALTNVKIELVVVEKISKEFGSKDASGTANIYADEKILKKTELPQIVGRNIGQKRKGKKAEKAKAAKKEEAPAPPAPKK